MPDTNSCEGTVGLASHLPFVTVTDLNSFYRATLCLHRSAVLVVVICLSACLSQAGIASKRLDE